MPDMGAALAVAPLCHTAQDTDQHPAEFLLFIDLIRHHGAQTALLGIEPDRVGHPLIHHLGIERAADVIRCAQVKGAPHRIHRVLAGDHDHRHVIQQLPPAHGFQHRKAVHPVHMDVQQHDGNTGGVLLQQPQAFLAAGCFCRVELLPQHPAQKSTVQRRIIHDQHALPAIRPGRCGRCGLALGHYRILLDAGIPHQALRVVHRNAQLLILDPDAADAGRHLDTGIARHAGGTQLQADLFQLAVEPFLRDVRQQQQQFVAAVTDQPVFFLQTAPDHVDRRFQHTVAGRPAVNVVGKLQIIQIQQRNAGRHRAVPVVFIVIPPVISTRCRVAIQFFGLVGNGAEQLEAVVRVQHQAAVHFLGHFQHTGFAVHLYIAGSHLIKLLVEIFQLAFPAFLFQRPPGHAVFTGRVRFHCA